MAVLFYTITKVNILEAFHSQGFASSVEIAKMNVKFSSLTVFQVILFDNRKNSAVNPPMSCIQQDYTFAIISIRNNIYIYFFNITKQHTI